MQNEHVLIKTCSYYLTQYNTLFPPISAFEQEFSMGSLAPAG